MSEKLSRSAVLRVAQKKLAIVAERHLRANLEMAGADLCEAYMIGAEEAQSSIVAGLALLKPLGKKPAAALHGGQE